MQGLVGAIRRTSASTLNMVRGHWKVFSREWQFSRVILLVERVECGGKSLHHSISGKKWSNIDKMLKINWMSSWFGWGTWEESRTTSRFLGGMIRRLELQFKIVGVQFWTYYRKVISSRHQVDMVNRGLALPASVPVSAPPFTRFVTSCISFL